jgi:hypothetical protein
VFPFAFFVWLKADGTGSLSDTNTRSYHYNLILFLAQHFVIGTASRPVAAVTDRVIGAAESVKVFPRDRGQELEQELEQELGKKLGKTGVLAISMPGRCNNREA